MKITKELLYAIAPAARAEIVAGIVANQSTMTASAIITPTHIAHFLGQCAYETQGFTRLEENLYYTSTKRLRQIWPSRFPSEAAAAAVVRNPEALANIVYGGRLGNRPGTGDGYAYRGSSCIMTTGRTNYGAVGAEANPDTLRKHPGALLAACVYWRLHNLNRFADAGDVSGLTKAIQGGQAGLADRKTYTDRALAWFNGGDVQIQFDQRSDWLRNGSRGKSVRELQTLLKLAGFYDDGKIDGDFGDGTENAVRDFQRARGLIADGVVGDATWKALGSASRINVPTLPGASRSNTLAALVLALLEAIGKLFKRGHNGKA